jgi:hypothetical protein
MSNPIQLTTMTITSTSAASSTTMITSTNTTFIKTQTRPTTLSQCADYLNHQRQFFVLSCSCPHQ